MIRCPIPTLYKLRVFFFACFAKELHLTQPIQLQIEHKCTFRAVKVMVRIVAPTSPIFIFRNRSGPLGPAASCLTGQRTRR